MIDLERMRWSKEDLQKWWDRQEIKRVKLAENATPIPRPRYGEKFIRGPIPLDWAIAAISAGEHTKSANVVLSLWFAAGFQRNNPVKLTPATLRIFGVGPKTARAALQSFEVAGLVELDCKRGRSPIVTIKSTGSDKRDAKECNETE